MNFLKRAAIEIGYILFSFAVVILAGFVMLLWAGFLDSAFGSAALEKDWHLVNGNVYCAQTLPLPKRPVIVAVIDTGVDPNHPDLAGHLWADPVKPEVFGWNFVTNKPNPTDEHGHGTHIAGIILKIAPNAVIMPIKYYSDANPGSVNLRNTVKAINYAIDNGARIINYSGGGPEFSEDEYLAIKRAEEKGILFITAAGNEKDNIDQLPSEVRKKSGRIEILDHKYYPGSYHLKNQLVVASTDSGDTLLKSSNYGRSSVNVTAPGEEVYSTLPGGRYGYMSGTSQATAFVTGIATMIVAAKPSIKPEAIKAIIVSTVDRSSQLAEKVSSGGRVNACRAVAETIRGQ